MAGIMLLVVGVLFFLVGCAYATIMLPAWTAQRRTPQGEEHYLRTGRDPQKIAKLLSV
jgi:hypothetical protein